MKFNVYGWHRSSLVLPVRFSALALFCAALALTAPAADIYWSGEGDGASWNSGANWTGGAVPGATDVAYINVRNTGITLNGTGTFTVRQIIFNVPSTLTIPAGCTLYLSNSGSAVLDANANITIDGGGDLSLSTASGVNYSDIRPAAGMTITINARITGVGGVENNGAGTVVLANPQNAYPGLTYITVANGVIEFPTLANAGAVCAIGAGDGFLATVANAMFRYTGTTAASTDRAFAINNSPVSFEQAGAAPVTLSGIVTNQSSGSRTFQLINNTAQPATFSGLLADGPGTLNLLKDGSGVWTLTTANTYSGSTTVSGGTLELAVPNALGSGPLSLSGGATLALNPSASGNYTATLPNLTVTGSGRIAIPAASSGTSTLTLSRLTVPGGFLVIDAPGAGTAANRIFVSNGLTAGSSPIPWIRLNGGIAQYDSTDGLKPYTPSVTAGIAALGGVIPQAPGQTVPITTPGSTGPITLINQLTEIGGLSQQEPATAATVDLAGGTLAANQIDITSSGAALTLGNGTLTAAAASPSGLASLIFRNDSTAPLTVAATVADNGHPVSLLQTGTGPTIFTGPLTHTGMTVTDSLLNLAPSTGILQTLGPISGVGGITKSGAGTSVFQGANTYTGLTRVEDGMLLVADSAALGLSAAGTVIESGAALALTDAAANTIAIKEPITFEGAGPDGLGALRTESLSPQQNAFQSLTLSGNATVGGSVATPNIPFDNANGRFDLRNGTLDLAGHSLTKAGPGAFMITSSEVKNVAPGTAIDVTGGALSLEGATDLQGSSGNTLTVRAGANFDLYRTLVPQVWTLALENGAHFSARSANSITENIWDGPVSLLGGQVLFGGSGAVSVSGQISGSGGIVKARGTTYLLNGNNQYTGATTVTNGVLYAAAPGSLPSHTPSKLNISQNGTLAVRYADDTGTWPLAWDADDVDTIATAAFFTQSSATLGFDPYYADATYGSEIHSFSLSKHGANTLTHTGAQNDIGTVRIYDGELVLAGDSYSLIGTSSLYPGSTGSTASYGILTITGDTQVIGADSGYRRPIAAIAPGQTGNSRGILNIRDNAFVQGRLYIGDTGAGAIYQTGGVFNNIAGAATDGRIGHNGYGYYQLDGGAVTNKGYTQLAAGGASVGILRQTGGEFIYKNGSVPAEGDLGDFYGGTFATRGGTALLHLSGGVLDTGRERLWLCEFDNGSGGYAVLTLEDDALLKADYIDMADRNASPVTIVNLNGGTIQTKYLRKGNRDNPTAAEAIINFSGGKLLATTSTSLITSAGETAPDLFVYGGGAVIDTTNYNTSITFPIKKPENYGVTGIRVITPGTGYIAPPFVKITGGGGRGATAVAEIDRVLGSLTAIRITSPGSGFTSIPTVTLLGGGAQTAGTIGLATIGLIPQDGGLTKLGTGALALSGANTWSGPTVIEDGMLSIAADGALPPETALFINGGTLDLANRTVTNAHTTLASGEIINGEIVTASLRKESDGEAFLKTGLTLTTNALPRAAPTPGLWEGVLFKNWDVTTPNPKTSIVLTTRAGNGAKAENTVYANGSWVGGNHTWVYSGYIWNRTSANVTWTWRGTFDDNVMLKIDQALVLNTGNSGTTATHTLTPGPHAIEIRFGDGTGSAGPEANITNLGGLTYDTGDGLGLRILEDPGDASLLSVDLGPVTPQPAANALPAEIANNVGELAAGYSLVYASDIPVTGGDINAGSPYTTDNSAANANVFDRVAYYVELVKGGETQWVWVSFDAVSHDRSLIGYPTLAKQVIAQSRLNNMDVRSNVPGISGANACQTGNIEFWPNDYSQTDAIGLGASSADNNTGYDFGDTVSGAPSPAAGRGSMQIHNGGEGTTLFAISNFDNGNNTLGIGLGNNPTSGGASDWTSANNAGDYTVRRLYVLTRDITLGAEPPPSVAVVAAGTLRISASKAGLYEGCIYNKNWDPTTPNPQTSIQLTTRAGNGTKAHNSVYADGLWAGNNHTWIYTGFLWNNTGAPVTWTFWASFDDFVSLTVDGTQYLYDNNSGGTRANVTLEPGANPIEIRFGDGGGDAGPNNSGLPGGLSYTTVLNSTNPADYHVLADPGDGSVLTAVANPPDTYVSNAEWEIAAGAALDLNGETAVLGAIRGAGTVTNGTLGANTVLSPGGDGNIDTLTLAGITFGGAVEYRVDIGTGTASDRVTSTTSLDLTNLRVTINNPSALQLRSQYVLLQADGGLTGTPDVSALPDKWRLLTRGNELILLAPSGTLMILK